MELRAHGNPASKPILIHELGDGLPYGAASFVSALGARTILSVHRSYPSCAVGGAVRRGARPFRLSSRDVDGLRQAVKCTSRVG